MFDLHFSRKRPVVAAAILALAAPALCSIGNPASAAGRFAFATRTVQKAVGPDTYVFETLDDAKDPTFNQLLGIDDAGLISGYFGSGAAGHPNRGYTLAPPYAQANYHPENFPGSAQTQVVALNNRHDTAGFWVDGNGNNFGFVEWNHVFTSYRDPNTGAGTVNQLLGLNDKGIAVGFYTDGSGVNHGYTVNQATAKYVELTPPGGSNVTATGINDNGDVTGFFTASGGAVVGFLLRNGSYSEFKAPKSVATTPFGINANDEIVGSYVDHGGLTHGFTVTNPLTHAHWTSIDDPNGVGTTIVNGVNGTGELVGFYVDAAGNTDGFLAKK